MIEIYHELDTVCPGSSDPPEKGILEYGTTKSPLNIIRLQSKIILGHMNSVG